MASISRHLGLLAVATVVACGGTAGRTAATPPATPSPSATASPSGTPQAPVVANRLWLLRQSQSPDIDIAEATAARPLATMPAGAITPDWTRLYAVRVEDSGGTWLHVLDPRSGALLDRVRVDPGMDLPDQGMAPTTTGLSPAGRRVVLSGGPRDSGGQLTTTLFRVYDTAHLHAAPHPVSLPGDFSFDVVDDAGRTLYLEQYTRLSDGSTSVALRRYDLVHDRLDPNPITPTGGCAAGSPLDAVSSADGAWQFGVWIFGSTGPYVRALDLQSGAATCIPLPPHGTSSGSAGEADLLWSLVRSHDGRHLYAANPAVGAVVEIDAAPPFRTRAGILPAPSASASPAAWSPFGATTAEAKRLLIGGSTLSPDGRLLYAAADQGIAVIDTGTLRLQRTLLPAEPPASLALTPDGRFLYAVSAAQSGGLFQVDTASGAVARLPQYSDASAVLRVQPAAAP